METLEEKNVKRSQERNKPHHVPGEISILMKKNEGKNKQKTTVEREKSLRVPTTSSSLIKESVWLESDIMWQAFQDKEKYHLNLFTHLFQNTLVEELLQFLIAVIDTELLKAVMFKILYEKKNIQYI